MTILDETVTKFLDNGRRVNSSASRISYSTIDVVSRSAGTTVVMTFFKNKGEAGP